METIQECFPFKPVMYNDKITTFFHPKNEGIWKTFECKVP